MGLFNSKKEESIMEKNAKKIEYCKKLVEEGSSLINDGNIVDARKILKEAAKMEYFPAIYLLAELGLKRGEYEEYGPIMASTRILRSLKSNVMVHNEMETLKAFYRNEWNAYNKGIELFNNGDVTAFEYFKRAADNGILAAQLMLVNFFSSEEDKNLQMIACRYLIEAAKLGDTHSQVMLGAELFNGKHIQKNFSEAIKWITVAAKQGEVEAMLLLSAIYENGYGCDKDVKEAEKWSKAYQEKQGPVSQELKTTVLKKYLNV